MDLLRGMVLTFKKDKNGETVTREKIWWVASDGSHCYTVDMDKDRPGETPLYERSDILKGLQNGAILFNQSDPIGNLPVERKITERRQGVLERLRRLWASLDHLMQTRVSEIINPATRSALFEAASKEQNCCPATYYKYFWRYLKGDGSLSAVDTKHDRCGGRGKPKSHSGKKRGRRTRTAQGELVVIGINVDPTLSRYMARHAQRTWEHQRKRSLEQCHQLFLELHYGTSYESKGGEIIVVLPSEDQMPTFDQYRYSYETVKDLARAIRGREGAIAFNLRHRPLIGNSTVGEIGPGSTFQIDATLGDIYLVSSIDRSRIIGRPVIYIVIDVFTRMIVGFAVTLEGPSWLGAMEALENTTADKVVYCAQYGIHIEESQWPSHHLPWRILADRGELEGYNIETLIENLGVREDTTAPYRADWKGIVERNFRLLNDKCIKWVPGAVYPRQGRGGPDYRLDAVLTLQEFRHLMIRCILAHNQGHHMPWYRMDEHMIRDRVDAFPIDLWEWGIKHRTGHLQTRPQDIIRMNLLPKGEATASGAGLRFNGLLYRCEEDLSPDWFIRKPGKKQLTLPVSYYPPCVETIYLRLDRGTKLVPCHLRAEEALYKTREWYEKQDDDARRDAASKSAQTRVRSVTANFHRQQTALIEVATAQKSPAIEQMSDAQRVKDIRPNRETERTKEREAHAMRLGVRSEERSSIGAVSEGSIDNQTEASSYVPPSRPVSMLRQLRKEALGK